MAFRLLFPYILWLAGLIATKVAWEAIRNIYFHPLSRFPGPKLAAANTWWRTVQEMFYGKGISDLLPQLHAKHGPIIRIAPNELHFAEPEAYHNIYNTNIRWNKDPFIYHSFGADDASFGYLTMEEAKPRKAILASIFSRKQVIEFLPCIHEQIDHFCSILGRNDQQGQSSNLLFGPRALTLTIITILMFGQDMWQALESPDFNLSILRSLNDSLPAFTILKWFPWVGHVLESLPVRVNNWLWPSHAGLRRFQSEVMEQVVAIRSGATKLDNSRYPVIFRDLMAAQIPFTSLYSEAQTLLTGGIENTSNTVMWGIWHLCHDKQLMAQVQAELQAIWPDPQVYPPLSVLEELPLFMAVVKEALRLAPGIPHPLTRVVPAQGVVIKGQFIPGGTVVGSSTLMVNRSAALFDEPDDFRPLRWLKPNAKELNSHLVAFGKGPRACMGINLAMAEVHLILGAILRRFDIELVTPGKEDLVWRECFIPYFSQEPARALFRPRAGVVAV